ncbi:sigma-70 family RNA polymerase sigma factor [Microbacterium paraoxydans]|uniref:sigma-70 family RNA polymerase sigma factor n=1 Tax=Microbacterium paraoxydans TaxID=199592 RepID=UPI001CF99962|nr:sigma-70 family RNA polymerase sigma factor [Microbacterium paraoxydans]
MSADEGSDSLSDHDLVERVRGGENAAYAELWRRHAGAAYSVARTFERLDADDIVSEAFVRVLRAIKAGGGPSTGFRPYLVMSVRNVGRRWYTQDAPLPVGELEYVIDPAAPEGELTVVEEFEGGAAVAAFRSLPTRWQEVLWYSEIDDMKPREISVLLGMAPNAVSALIVRAKRGLRDGWISAQLAGAKTPECETALKAMGAHTRSGLSDRARRALESHLSSCPTCPEALAEAKNLATLTMSVLPAVAGVAGAAGYMSTLEAPPLSVAMASGLDAMVTGPSAAVGDDRRRRRTGVIILLLILVAALVALGFYGVFSALTVPEGDSDAGSSTTQPAPGTSAESEVPATSTPSPGTTSTPTPTPSPPGGDPQLPPGSNPGTDVPPASDPGAPGQNPPGSGEIPSVPAAPGATLTQFDSRMYPRLSGDAAPRAVIEVVDSGGATIVTTTASADGTWSAHLTAAPAGSDSVSARQVTDGGRSPASAPMTYTLASPPPAATPVSGSTVSAARFRFAFTAAPGTIIQRQIVGSTPVQTLRVPSSGAWNEYLATEPGDRSLRLRYANPATGDYGPWATWSFTAE